MGYKLQIESNDMKALKKIAAHAKKWGMKTKLYQIGNGGFVEEAD